MKFILGGKSYQLNSWFWIYLMMFVPLAIVKDNLAMIMVGLTFGFLFGVDKRTDNTPNP